jgi:hypothetical protein
MIVFLSVAGKCVVSLVLTAMDVAEVRSKFCMMIVSHYIVTAERLMELN